MNGPGIAPPTVMDLEEEQMEQLRPRCVNTLYPGSSSLLPCLLACLVSMCKGHYILALDCQSTLLLYDSRYDVLLMEG